MELKWSILYSIALIDRKVNNKGFERHIHITKSTTYKDGFCGSRLNVSN